MYGRLTGPARRTRRTDPVLPAIPAGRGAVKDARWLDAAYWSAVGVGGGRRGGASGGRSQDSHLGRADVLI